MIRRGGVLMEAVTALMLLSLLVIATGQIVSVMNRQSRLLTQRTIALQECQTALEQVAALDAKNLDADALSAIALPQGLADTLPEGRLEISRIDPKTSAEGTQIKATVRWRAAATAELAETSLSLWRNDLAPDPSRLGAAP
jgi:hypothetical protein